MAAYHANFQDPGVKAIYAHESMQLWLDTTNVFSQFPNNQCARKYARKGHSRSPTGSLTSFVLFLAFLLND